MGDGGAGGAPHLVFPHGSRAPTADDTVVAVGFAVEPPEDDDTYAAAEGLLSEEERARARRFRFDVDRRRFTVARGLVRRMLSRQVDVAPADWRIEADAQGRPFVAAPADGGNLRFSASHTEGLVLCAVAVGRAIGADVERVRERAPLEVAGRFFAPSEVAALDAFPPGEQGDAFFRFWTLKESYAKARGLGLSLPLRQLAFDLDGGPRAAFDPALGDDPAAWRFFSLRPTPRHRAAICAGRHDGADVTLVTSWDGLAPHGGGASDQR